MCATRNRVRISPVTYSIRMETSALCSAISALMEGTNGREPTVPFEVFDDYTQFRETGYDFVTMAQSPRYAPASADRIMRLLEPYVMKIDG